jgi:hypothetical protein
MVSQLNTMAQGDAGSLIKGGVKDANALMTGYLTPFGKSFGANMNSGWYNTGQPLKPGRFELKAVVNLAFAPSSEQTFSLLEAGIGGPKTVTIGGQTATEEWKVNGNSISAANGDAPTVFGADALATTTISKTLTYTKPGAAGPTTETLASIPLVGSGVSINPIPPAAQLSVGLIKSTELMIRFIPKINQTVGDSKFSFNLWGVGVKHDFKQWIPGMAELPFDLSAIVAYSSMKTSLGFSNPILPTNGSGGTDFATPGAGSAYTYGAGEVAYNVNDYKNQALEFSSHGWNANLIISKKLSILTVYGGFRLSNAKTTVKLAGNYGVATDPYVNTSDIADTNNGKQKLVKFADPINIPMKITQPGALAGIRIKLAIIAFFAEYQVAKYSTFSAGVSLGWMN